jgi:prepilin-type N-terminal cleavage/methylation domain-containing protein
MKTKDKKRGFTIIELLTVLSIIIILLAMLVPTLNAVRRFAKVVTQKGQFHDISKGLEMFRIDFGDAYPDSSQFDLTPDPYCGAMKLCEAMVGQDGLGFHPDSVFDNMGLAADGVTQLYYNRPPGLTTPTPTLAEEANLRTRKVKYMEGAEFQMTSIGELFPLQSIFDKDCAVICDVFKRTGLRNAKGQKLGMPILYYKADSTKLTHNSIDGVASKTNIYDYLDNDQLLGIDVPWMTAPNNKHPLFSNSLAPDLFYSNTKDKAVTTMDKPHNPNSFILLSAGWDGLYGTRDDIYNFMEQ